MHATTSPWILAHPACCGWRDYIWWYYVFCMQHRLRLPFQISIAPFDDILQDECPLNLRQGHVFVPHVAFGWKGLAQFFVGPCLFHVLHLHEENLPTIPEWCSWVGRTLGMRNWRLISSSPLCSVVMDHNLWIHNIEVWKCNRWWIEDDIWLNLTWDLKSLENVVWF